MCERQGVKDRGRLLAALWKRSSATENQFEVGPACRAGPDSARQLWMPQVPPGRRDLLLGLMLTPVP